MTRIKRLFGFVVFLGLPCHAEEPLSAIDWLKAPLPAVRATPVPETAPEPRLPIAESALAPDVDVLPLDGSLTVRTGLLSPEQTGFSTSIWSKDDSTKLQAALKKLPNAPLPALQALIFTLLLTEADPPANDNDDAFLEARIKTLRKYGAVYQAHELLDLTWRQAPELFARWLETALLLNEPDAPCAVLEQQPDLPRTKPAHIYCLARSGDWHTAALTYEVSLALGLLSPLETDLLAVYLDPEVYAGEQPVVRSNEMTPLIYRLLESAGNRRLTTILPLEYAVADLDEVAGWKAQIEAAERLTRRSALASNHLLGLYTAQKASASGGVWDRVRAVQRLDLAITRQDPAGIDTALPRAWEAMQEVGLELVIAELFARDVSMLSPHGTLWIKMGLLSPDYEWIAGVASAKVSNLPPDLSFAISIASRNTKAALANTDLEKAIADGLTLPVSDPANSTETTTGTGYAILTLIRRLHAAPSDLGTIRNTLHDLRSMGLDETARQTALQLLLL